MQVQILNYSASIYDDGTFRLDAEHYQEKFIKNQQRLIKFGAISLKDMISQPVMTGHTPPMKNKSYYGGNISFIKTDNLREFKIVGTFTHYLSVAGNKIIKRSSLRENDLIVTIIGATYKVVGRAALVSKENLPANINQNIALIRLKDGYSPQFLSVYLNSKVGKLALWYLTRQTEQVNLNCREIEKILVPNVSRKFLDKIEDIYKRATGAETKSKHIFRKIQNILLSELGLLNWQPKHQLTFIRNFSDTQKAERFDAEYFQPKYDDIVNGVKNYSGGWDTLENLCELIGHPSNPPYSKEIKNNKTFIITQKYLGDFTLNDEFWKDSEALYTTDEFIEKNSKYIVRYEDILLYSVGAYIGKANIFLDDVKTTIGSFLTLVRVRKDLINPYYLTLFLNTEIGILLSKRHQRGMAQQYLYPYDIKTFPIPLLKDKIQKQIQQKITESFNIRKKSKKLLRAAKRAVEIAIEQDENIAIEWLNNEVGRIDVD